MRKPFFCLNVAFTLMSHFCVTASFAQVTNFDNSPLNYNATNGVYDNKGNRLGYEVRSPQGVTNIYDNKGNRTGYIPAPSR